MRPAGYVPPFSVTPGVGAFSPPVVVFPDLPAPEANRLLESVANHNKLLALEVVRLRNMIEVQAEALRVGASELEASAKLIKRLRVRRPS